MAYEAKTDDSHTKWWVIGTGSVVNRLSEVMDDCPLGPAIYYTTGWTASGSEFYRSQTKQNDAAAAKLGAGAWTALVLGSGVGALTAGQYFYDVATSRLYVRLTGDVAPNATNQVRAHYSWTGGLASASFMTEVLEDRLYHFHKNCDGGDGSTATTITMVDEVCLFDVGVMFYPKNQITWSIDRSFLSFLLMATYDLSAPTGATLAITDSILSFLGNQQFSFNITANQLSFTNTTILTDHSLYWKNVTISKAASFTNCRLDGAARMIFGASPTIDGLHIDNCFEGIAHNNINVVSITGLKITNNTLPFSISGNGGSLTLIDPDFIVSTPVITVSESNYLAVKFRVNIKVVGPTGAAINGATVVMKNTSGTTVFTQTTAADGTITEQQVEYKRWTGTSETLTDSSPHTITVSMAGYETLTIPAITLFEAIDWTLELQPTIDFPARESVLSTDTVDSEAGLFDITDLLPANLRNGITVGAPGVNAVTGTITLPAPGNLLEGETCGAAGTEITGTRQDADPASVLESETYGDPADPITGTYDPPEWFFGQALAHELTEQHLVHTLTEQHLTHAIVEQQLTHVLVEQQLAHVLTEQHLTHEINA